MIQIASPQIGKEEREAVDRVLRSGIIAQGPEVAKFEKEFAKLCGVKYAVAACNGTTAGHLVMLASGIGPGDEVITTPFTFFATASVVIMAGAKPVFVDVEEDGFCLDPSKVEAAITDKTKAIHPVHLYGELADMPSFMEITKRNNLLLIEDSAQAHCANSWDGNAGSFGKAAWFSFYPTKNMTTSEGGIITTNDEDFANKCKIIRAHGMSAQYQHTEFGYNYRMTDISAAIGREQLKKLPNFNARRREIAERYNSELSDLVITPKNRRGHVFHQYTIRILSGRRNELANFLSDLKIPFGIYYPIPLHKQNAYKNKSYKDQDFKNTNTLCDEVISLPMHSELTDDQIDYISSKINKFLT